MTPAKRKKTPKTATFDVLQGGMIVASVSGPFAKARADAWHYAMVYSQDGPVRIHSRAAKRKVKGE